MSHRLRTAAAAACLLAAALNLSTSAQARPGGRAGECSQSPGEPGGAPAMWGHAGGHGPLGFGHAAWGHGGIPPWMHHLDLSEAQQDSVFQIMHGREPALRDQFKQVAASRKALMSSSLNAGADPAQLQALASAAGQADAALALMMAQTDQQLLAVLTPAQQAHLKECLPN